MTSTARTPNWDEGLSARDNITGINKYLTGTATGGVFALDISGGSGGGGTQYTNGTVQASPTGTVALGYDGTTVRALKTSADGTLKTQLDAAQGSTSGTVTTAASTITMTDLTGIGAVTVQISGTYAGVDVTFEASPDGSNWTAIAAQPLGATSPTLVTSTGVLTTNSTNVWNVAPLLGIGQFRVRATAYGSGTANVLIVPSAQFVQYQNTVNGSVMLSDMTGSGTITTQNLVPAGVATANSAVEIAVSAGFDTLVTQVTGTYTGALSLQATINGTTWVTIGSASVFYRQSNGTFNGTIGSAIQDIFQSNIAGFTRVRVTALAAVTGTATLSLRLSYAGALIALDAPLPAGTNVIGAITTIVPGTAATNLGKAEDAVHNSGDVGVFALNVRNDNGATTFGANGDYSAHSVDVNGRSLITMKSPTGTGVTIAASVSNTLLLAANTARLGAVIWNSSTAILYVKLGVTASTTSFTVQLVQNAYYEVPFGYTGTIDGVWASATGDCRVTELT